MSKFNIGNKVIKADSEGHGTIIEEAYGGTGLASSPSMLVNLASTTAADVFQTTPRPGVTGVLPVSSSIALSTS